MKIKKTNILECNIIIGNKKSDNRGFFQRIYCKQHINFTIKQTNISSNLKKGTLRGFHYQQLPSKENKIISCIAGSFFNVVIDLRKKSKTYKKIFKYNLKENDNCLIFVPAGCANCYLTLENNTKILYFMEDYYKPKKNLGFHYKSFNKLIKWPTKIINISTKDLLLPKLK